jgi:error-prone DNA polymerase
MPDAPDEKLYNGPAAEPPAEVAPCDHPYAELDVTTNFSFLRGASHPDELVFTAASLGYRAMAVTDVNSLAGVVRAYEATRKVKGFRLIVGARLVFADGTPDLLAWPADLAAYGRLCRLLTAGKHRAEKGACLLTLDDLAAHGEGLLAAISSEDLPPDDAVVRLRDATGDRLSLAVRLSYGGDDDASLLAARALARRTRVPLLATNHVHYHAPFRRRLQDVLTCVRHGCTIREAGYRLFPNGEYHLKSPAQMHRLFARCPDAISRGLEIASRCTFDLSELKYEYPVESVPPDTSPSEHLRALTYAGAADKYPSGVPPKVTDQIEKELRFICGSRYESYFLTVYDLVREARSRGILCQGRGSAANSAVCYCLGVTAVDPMKFNLVFERFASGARSEPPDIDIDFEHERREEVIQYVYEKYGRDRAAMAASLITYRGRSAVRDVGKALGLGRDTLDQLAGKLDWWNRGSPSDAQLRECGVDDRDPTVRHLVDLTGQLLGFPRHLSQHVGGMVISRSPLHELVPVENAAMERRTVIEWDKDDLQALKLFKVDILALGMLTALSKGLAMVGRHLAGPPPELHTIPAEDGRTYDMICDADTVGVFQVESRAQMSMLPRLRPRKFYDLVIQVAIVRPGPIQGGMVHPYLARREALRADPAYEFECPKEELREVLEGTLGVPLFQEQAMRLAVVAAGFTPDESDALRRAMAAWKRGGGIHKLHDKFVNGMTSRGYEPEFAERCFDQISGFGEYGFPESHAASFAILVYASAWLKRHHPAAFAAGLLNSQPMGFYAPAQLVRDAREHGVDVRPVDVNASDWDCTLEPRPSLFPPAPPEGRHGWGSSGPALRLGFRQVKGMRQADAERIVRARPSHGPFTSVAHLRRACDLSPSAVDRLARADALASLRLSRREASWDALALPTPPSRAAEPTLWSAHDDPHLPVDLPPLPAHQEVSADYATVGLSLRPHPVTFARTALAACGVTPAHALQDVARFPHGRRVKVAGLVLVRQRPGTAGGVVFVTLEDETGTANLILWSAVYDLYRTAARQATLLQVDGIVQREGQVIHVLAQRLTDRSPLLHDLRQPSRDFH